MTFEYLKLDTTHGDYNSAVEALRKHFNEAFPQNNLSINTNGSVAWVKVCEGHGVTSKAIQASVSYADRAKVAAEIATWKQDE